MQTKKEVIYAKHGCPFTFRYLLFVSHVGRLSDFDIRVAVPGEDSYSEIVAYLAEMTGAKASFPTVQTKEGDFIAESDVLISRLARIHGVSIDDVDIIGYFDRHMAPVNRSIIKSLSLAQARIEELERGAEK